MSEAGQDWARRGAAADEDPALRAFAAGGALLLWDAESHVFGYANAPGEALLGGKAAQAILPSPTRQRLALLASGLASPAGIRMERLRLTPSFAALALTCGCKLISVPGSADVLAIAVPASELRRLGISLPGPVLATRPESASPAETPPAPAAPVSQAPLPATIRFLWQSDAEGRLTKVSDAVAVLAGAEAASRLVGQRWSELLGRNLFDHEGGLLDRLGNAATWSGHTVLWRTSTPGEAAPVELSGVPVFDVDRQLAGFRGFGLAKLSERGPLPEQPDAALEPPSVGPEAVDVNVPEPAAAAEAEAKTAGADTVEPEGAAQHAPAIADMVPAEPFDAPGETAAQDDEQGERAEAPETEQDSEPLAAEAPAEDEAAAEPPVAAAPEPAQEPDVAPGNIVPLRHGQLAIRPVLEPSKTNLSSAERNAFREIAKALGARLAEDGPVSEPRLPPVAPLRVKEREAKEADAASAAVAPPAPLRQRNAHADLLDRLPIAVLVSRGEEALYANRTLLDLLDYADLDDLRSAGGVSRLIKEAARSGGGAMKLIDRLNHLVSVDAALSSIEWQEEPAMLMAFRHPDGGGEVPVLTPEEAEEAELAAEFEAEEAEAAARVEALRLDAEVRDGRIAELTAMLDTATDGVVTVDDRGRILSLNKAAEALFGYDQREVTGELLTLLFANESHAPALDYLEGLKGGGVASVLNDGREVFGRVRQGGKIPLFMTMGQIAHGAESRFCAVLRDITAWKKTEGELVDARKAAELASAQKSDVLAKISHEIRTPLNAIIGFAEVMAEERFGPIGNERYKEYLRDIHQSGGYVISLVNDLLDLAKIEAGKLDLDFVSVSLNDIALSTVALLQPEAQRGRVVLRSGLSPKLPPVVADERSIRQITINLLSNAVKFTDAGGQVIISTALGDQGEAILRVRDTGIGMDDDELKLALEPFRQVPTTRRSGGTGLGLPLTKALVEANRAAMSITSVKKEGTLVEITFPPQRVLAS
ncbi:ATP-binding protein [Bosea sp. TND4EK4]|uniref:sensor histidine kinase n=2 Tax=unclassified Bosea (in: a-proteobacteria) TaxID=2653178 RepID=UPI0009559DF1|nr:ATP-binding protein [Bosea sp. TND4EK4]SIQ06068.1 PAS/PAC sensor signal transduction histidine kinase [Bosea sp. TND4EK4]